MHRIIAGGTGLIGKRLVEHWLQSGHTITVIGRSKDRIVKMFGQSVQAMSWDKVTTASLESAEVVVNLAGENVAAKRWNPIQKKEMITSRVGSTKMLADLLAPLGKQSPPWFNASAIGIYGLQAQLPDRLPPRLDESTVIDWEHPTDFLSEVGRRWEKAAEPAMAAGVRVVFLRFGVVLAPEGGALPQIVKPFKMFMGGPIGTGNQPFSWVAIDDVINAIDFLLTQKEVVGPYNIVAPGAIQQSLLGEAIARLLNRPDVVRVPAFLAKPMFGDEMAKELLLEGQRVYPQRLLDLGFKFTYPQIEPALHHLLIESLPPPGEAQEKSGFSKMMGDVFSRFKKKDQR